MKPRDRDTSRLEADGICSDFLAIDGDTAVHRDRLCWSHDGRDISLSANDWICLRHPHTSDISALTRHPHVAPWIRDSERIITWYPSCDRGASGTAGRRRLGRLLFAAHADQIRQVLVHKVALLTKNNSIQQCAVHIFTSLAGGTGSGCLIDMIAMIRELDRSSFQEESFPIFVYAYVTSRGTDRVDDRYFYANQFTTLRDLNAMLCNNLAPAPFAKEQAGKEYPKGSPCAQVFLMTEMTGNHRIISLRDQIIMVARFCFERTSAWNVGEFGHQIESALGGEGMIASFPGEPLGRPERSFRFAGFGIKCWEVPNQEIEKLLSLDLLASSLRQMIFNNWQDDRGYVECPSRLTEDCRHARSRILKEEVCEEYLLMGNRVSKMAETLRTETDQIIKGMLEQSCDSSQRRAAISVFRDRVRWHYEHCYLGEGVDAFFEKRKRNLSNAISEAIESLDRKVSEFWLDRSSTLGLHDLPGLIAGNRQALQDECSNIEQRLTEFSEESHRLATQQPRLEDSYVRAGMLAALLGKRKALFLTLANSYVEGVTLDLQRRCCESDLELMRPLIDELQELCFQYDKVLLAASKFASVTGQMRQEIDTTLRVRDRSFQTGESLYEFDQESIYRFLRVMQTDRMHQDSSGHAMRLSLCEFLRGRTLNYLGKAGAGVSDELAEMLKMTARRKLREIHSDLEMRNGTPRVLNISLIDRLQARFADDDSRMSSEVEEFIRLTSTCLPIRNGEMQPTIQMERNRGSTTMPQRVVILGLPVHEDGYAARLRESFGQLSGQDVLFDTYTHDDPSKLSLIFVDHWLAARFATVVHEIGERYSRMTLADISGDIAYFSNIDHDGETGNRPSLFLPDPNEMRIAFEAEIWLGSKLNAPAEAGENAWLITEDVNGIWLLSLPDGHNCVWMRLGDDLSSTLDEPEPLKMAAVHAAVTSAIPHLTNIEKKAVMESIGKEDGKFAGMQTSPDFGHWQQLKSRIEHLIRDGGNSNGMIRRSVANVP